MVYIYWYKPCDKVHSKGFCMCMFDFVSTLICSLILKILLGYIYKDGQLPSTALLISFCF